MHGFTNIDLPMQQSIDLLRRKLGAIYPPGEIIGFTRMIFESLCGYTPTDILLHKDTILSEDIHRKIERITDRLSQQEPIQYILGYTDFCGRRFDIAPGALIPRPETEELTRLVITENSGQPSRIADLGTGSGCIAVTLALSLSDSKVEAWDISTEALEIAQRNARKHNAHVNFFQRGYSPLRCIRTTRGIIRHHRQQPALYPPVREPIHECQCAGIRTSYSPVRPERKPSSIL